MKEPGMDVEIKGNQVTVKPSRIGRIQTVTLVLLFIAGIVNFLDRSSLSVEYYHELYK